MPPVTRTEDSLARLARESFLSLWTHPNVFRNTGLASKGGDGQELCDLLAILGDDVIVFSDKECVLGPGDLATTWPRWYRRAVLNSLKQMSGAVRWLREHPDRVFADKRCTESLGWLVPRGPGVRVHRVIVANGASSACVAALGGRGTLMHMPAIPPSACPPFTVPRLEIFAHVFDEVGLRLVLTELDTISDLVAYLRAREAFMCSGKLVSAAGEEDLLGYYLSNAGPDGSHGFPVVGDAMVLDNYWPRFEQSAERQARNHANAESYVWDRLIEHAAVGGGPPTLVGGEGYVPDRVDLREPVLRAMASEPRLHRRALARDWFTWATSGEIGYRVCLSQQMPARAYVFLVQPRDMTISYEEHRSARTAALGLYAMLLAHRNPALTEVVGIARDRVGPPGAGNSEDFLFYEPGDALDAETLDRLEEFRAMHRLFEGQRRREYFEPEYPVQRHPIAQASFAREDRVGRNDACPCGSGSKYKRCHGRGPA